MSVSVGSRHIAIEKWGVCIQQLTDVINVHAHIILCNIPCNVPDKNAFTSLSVTQTHFVYKTNCGEHTMWPVLAHDLMTDVDRRFDNYWYTATTIIDDMTVNLTAQYNTIGIGRTIASAWWTTSPSHFSILYLEFEVDLLIDLIFYGIMIFFSYFENNNIE